MIDDSKVSPSERKRIEILYNTCFKSGGVDDDWFYLFPGPMQHGQIVKNKSRWELPACFLSVFLPNLKVEKNVAFLKKSGSLYGGGDARNLMMEMLSHTGVAKKLFTHNAVEVEKVDGFRVRERIKNTKDFQVIELEDDDVEIHKINFVNDRLSFSTHAVSFDDEYPGMFNEYNGTPIHKVFSVLNNLPTEDYKKVLSFQLKADEITRLQKFSKEPTFRKKESEVCFYFFDENYFTDYPKELLHNQLNVCWSSKGSTEGRGNQNNWIEHYSHIANSTIEVIDVDKELLPLVFKVDPIHINKLYPLDYECTFYRKTDAENHFGTAYLSMVSMQGIKFHFMSTTQDHGNAKEKRDEAVAIKRYKKKVMTKNELRKDAIKSKLVNELEKLSYSELDQKIKDLDELENILKKIKSQ